MRIHPERVKKLRMARQWSQEQLAAACGVNLRTIQRLENTSKGSMESVRAIAAVFEIDANDLILSEPDAVATPLSAIRTAFLKAVDFSGTASRLEYWCFFAFALLMAAVAAVIADKLYQIVGLILLLPLLSVGARRLRDTGHSGWWQLLFLVPFGQVVVLCMLSLRSRSEDDQRDAKHADPA
jgi:transcriptional regulator with XRE-family HTH domain